MHRRLALWAVLLLAFPAYAWAQESASSTMSAEKPHFEASQQVSGKVTIVAIDKANRLATIKSQHGDTVTVQVGPEVKNFDQLKKGDVVKVMYTETLTIDVAGPGEPGASAAADMQTAKQGEKPGMAYTEHTQVKATITAIDKTKGTATLKLHDGTTHVVTPADPANLDKVKVGDLLVINYTQAVAASVEKSTSTKKSTSSKTTTKK